MSARKPNPQPPIDILKALLDYDPASGVFKHVKTGKLAGTLTDRNYRVCRVAGKLYRAHRLAWLYVYGEWPDDDIDHIDMDRDNNRIQNLRKSTRSQNHANRLKYSNNTSGYKGVSWYKNGKKWKAQIGINGQNRSLGYYDSKEEAYSAYCVAAIGLFGDFARVG